MMTYWLQILVFVSIKDFEHHGEFVEEFSRQLNKVSDERVKKHIYKAPARCGKNYLLILIYCN